MVIGIIVAGTWLMLTFFAVALSRVAGRADRVTDSAPVRDVVRSPARAQRSSSRRAGARVTFSPH